MRCQAQRGVPGAGREHWAVRAVCWVAILGLLAIHGPQARADLITSQDWDFNNAPQNPRDIRPESVMNPHGQPSLDVPQGAGWIAGVGGRTGILQPAGPMFFNVPDAGRTDLSKTLLLLLRYQFLNGPDLLGQPLVVDSTGSPFTLVPGSEARTPDILPGWRLYTAQWTFPTCPPNETVIIGAGTPQIPLLVDFVFIRTECVPEPSTFTLAGLCAVVLLGYAWRRQRAKAA